jgi:putative flippase GtrA
MGLGETLARYGATSLATAVVDNLVFILAYGAWGSVLAAQGLARAAAVWFQYGALRHVVFYSHDRHSVTLPRYLLLVAANGLVAYGLIRWLMARFGAPAVWAKIGVESALFVVTFAAQRGYVFARRMR